MTVNYKGKLLELLQCQLSSVESDVVEFKTARLPLGFQCSISLPSVAPGKVFQGECTATKREAEQSAAKVIVTNKRLAGEITGQAGLDLGRDLMKNRLLEMFQKKGLPPTSVEFRVPQSVSPFQCTIAIPSVLPGVEFVGEPSFNKKDAERSAVNVLLKDKASVHAISSLQPQPASTETTETVGMAKNSLQELLQKKGYPTSSAVYTTSQVNGGFVCQLTVECIRPGQMYEGGPCSAKKEAEKEAAFAFLTNRPAFRLTDEGQPTTVTTCESSDTSLSKEGSRRQEDPSNNELRLVKRRKIQVKVGSV